MLRMSAFRPAFSMSSMVSSERAVSAIGNFNESLHVISNPRGGVQVCIVVRSGVRLPHRGQKFCAMGFGDSIF